MPLQGRTEYHVWVASHIKIFLYDHVKASNHIIASDSCNILEWQKISIINSAI